MSQHHHLLEMYKPGINTDMAFPVDAGNRNDTSDRWAFKPGFSSDPTPVDKALWAESGKDVAKYKVAFAEKYEDAFKKPFTQSTMMVAPVQWQTGYNDAASNALALLAVKQGEAKEIMDAIGVLNTAIERLEGLLDESRATLRQRNSLRRNTKYIELANDKAPELVSTLDSDIVALEALVNEYASEIQRLHTHGRVLNQELDALLSDYKQTANTLNINDNFEKEMRKAQRKSGTRGLVTGGVAGFMGAAALVFIIAQARRSPQRVRSTRRGADSLFFRSA
jgi:uncharacterized small protein (DUF1192 family)